MDNIRRHLKKHCTFYILAAILLAFCIVPLVILRMPSGHDYSFHLCRIQEISKNISHGQWFSPIYYDHTAGYGYASPLFYGDWFLHLPGLLVTLGLSVEQAFRTFLVLCVSCCALASYLCFKKITKTGLGGLVGAVLFTFSSYMSMDFMTRTALGEIQAFAFCPIILLGFFSILYEDGRHWYALPLGLCGLLISHTISAVMMVVFLLVISLFYIGRFIRDKKKILLVALSALSFFAFSAFFIFPMIEQMAFQPLRATDGTTDTIWGTLASRAMPFFTVFSDFNNSLEKSAWYPNGIGICFFALAAYVIYLTIKKKSNERPLIYLLISLMSLIVITDLFPWNLLQNICGSIQFPWRIMLFATLFFALSAAFSVSAGAKERYTRYVAAIMILLSLFSYTVTALPKLKIMIENEKNHTALNTNYSNAAGAGEYYPSGTNWKGMISRGDRVLSNNHDLLNTVVVTREYNRLTVSFEGNTKEDAYLELPLVMYKGYAALTEDGTALELWGNKGYMRADISGIESAVITVEFTRTPVMIISYIISAASFAALLVYLFQRRKKARTQLQTHTPCPSYMG